MVCCYPIKSQYIYLCICAGKKCSTIPFTFAVISFILLILSSSYSIYINYPLLQHDKNDAESNTFDLHIPAMSVVEMKISTTKSNKINLTAFNETRLIRVATDRNKSNASFNSFKLNLTLRNGEDKLIIRYWNTKQSVKGNITLDGQHFIAYKWGNLTNPPLQDGCHSNESTLLPTEANFTEIQTMFRNKIPNQDLICIYFCCCKDENITDLTTVNINIIEYFTLPDELSYKYIYIDETCSLNSIVLEFDKNFLQINETSRLYINTHHTSSISFANFSDLIYLKIKSYPSEDEIRVIETVVSGVAAILFLCLFLVFFVMGICCCCHCKDKEFYAVAVFYKEKNV